MILSAQTIHRRVSASMDAMTKGVYIADALRIEPFFVQKQVAFGMSYGLSSCGYDICLGKLDYPDKMPSWKGVALQPGGFVLAASMELMELPNDLCGVVHDKSTWARRGLALQNTVLEPGWRGYITLELSNHGTETILLEENMPIAQVLFHQLDHPTILPYRGKYQDQPAEPTPAKFEELEANAPK